MATSFLTGSNHAAQSGALDTPGFARMVNAQGAGTPRHVRASSDPGSRGGNFSMTALIQNGMATLDSEPNPFEHSFSSGPSAPSISAASGLPGTSAATSDPAAVAAVARRARSNSPPTAGTPRGLLTPGAAAAQRMPSFSFMNTPGGSDALANFGWPLDHSLRTGFTPLPQGSAAGSGAPGEASAFAPTSPQTAALFAMMTNNTPGAAQPAHASAKERNAFEASFAASSAGQRASSGTPVTSAPFPGNMSAQQHHMALPAHMQHQVRQIPIASGGGVPGTGAPGAPGVSAPGQHNPLFMLSQHAQEQHRGSPVSGQQQPPRQPSDRGPQQRNGAGEHDDLAAAAALSNLQSGPFSPMPQEVKDALAAAGASVMPGQTVAGAMSAAASGNTMNAPTKSQPHQPQPAYSATVTASASGLPSRQPNKRAAPSSNASGGGKRRRGAANRNKSADFEYDEDGDGDSVGVKDEGDDYDDVDDQQGSARKPSRRASARRGKAAVAAAVKGDDQMGPDDDDMDDDMEGGDGDGENMNDDIEFGGTGKGGRKGKGAGGRKSSSKFETDDDKRRNFLERNRQAALKCRQRKKAWLASLQQKVEYLSTDNETLSQTIGNLKEEIQSLRSILAAHANCPIALENQQRPPSQYAHRQPVQGRY